MRSNCPSFLTYTMCLLCLRVAYTLYRKGERFTCDLTVKGDWLPALLNGKKGLVPRNYVKAQPLTQKVDSTLTNAKSIPSAKVAAAARSRRRSSTSSRRGSVIRHSISTPMPTRAQRSGSVIEHSVNNNDNQEEDKQDVKSQKLHQNDPSRNVGRGEEQEQNVEDEEDEDEDEDEEWFDIHFLQRSGDQQRP